MRVCARAFRSFGNVKTYCNRRTRRHANNGAENAGRSAVVVARVVTTRGREPYTSSSRASALCGADSSGRVWPTQRTSVVCRRPRRNGAVYHARLRVRTKTPNKESALSPGPAGDDDVITHTVVESDESVLAVSRGRRRTADRRRDLERPRR